MTSGSCLCGAVRYTISGPMRPVIYCHCEPCRRTSGHHVAATACRNGDIAIKGDGSLTWYRSSPGAERGFCGRCGSNLFYRAKRGDTVSVMAGSLDVPTGLDAVAHIFVDRKSDYYSFSDELPRHNGYGGADMGVPDA